MSLREDSTLKIGISTVIRGVIYHIIYMDFEDFIQIKTFIIPPLDNLSFMNNVPTSS